MESKHGDDFTPPSSQPSVARQRSGASSPAPTPPSASPREHPAGPAPAGGGWLSSIPGSGLVYATFNVVSQLLGVVLSPLNSVVGGRTSTPPDAMTAARQFVTHFESAYGAGGPTFVEASYQDTLATANADCRMVLIYLHSGLNQDTEQFCRETLHHPPLVELINSRFVCWGGDVAEAHALEASVSFAAPSYPFLGVYIPASSGNNYRRVWSHEGMITGEALLRKLQSAVAAATPVLDGIQAERISREADRRLREEQDQRYEEALRKDRERVRKQEEAEEAKELEAAKELSEQLSREAELARIRERLPEEPSVGTTEETTRLRLTLPDGTKIQRRFFAADTLQTVFDFVRLSLHDLGSEVKTFDVGSSYPRKTFTADDNLDVDLKTLGLHPQAALFVTGR